MANKEKEHESLLDSVRKLTGQVAGSTLELARNTATMTAMFGENWLRLAQALSKAEEYAEAGDALTKVLQLGPPPDHSYEHGRWLEEARDPNLEDLWGLSHV